MCITFIRKPATGAKRELIADGKQRRKRYALVERIRCLHWVLQGVVGILGKDVLSRKRA